MKSDSSENGLVGKQPINALSISNINALSISNIADPDKSVSTSENLKNALRNKINGNKKLSNEYIKLNKSFNDKLDDKVSRGKLYNKSAIKADKFIKDLLSNDIKSIIKKYTALKNWISTSGIKFDNNKTFNESDLLKAIDNYFLQFKDGYYPFTKKEKDKLPKIFHSIAYNEYNQACPSILFKMLLSPPKMYEDTAKLKKDENPEFTDMYISDFFKRDFNIRERNQVIDAVGELVNFWRDNVDMKIDVGGKIYLRKQIEPSQFQNNMGIKSPKKFIKNHINYLNTQSVNVRNFTKVIPKIKTRGFYWETFTSYYKTEYGIELYPDGKYLKNLAKDYEDMLERQKK